MRMSLLMICAYFVFRKNRNSIQAAILTKENEKNSANDYILLVCNGVYKKIW